MCHLGSITGEDDLLLISSDVFTSFPGIGGEALLISSELFVPMPMAVGEDSDGVVADEAMMESGGI